MEKALKIKLSGTHIYELAMVYNDLVDKHNELVDRVLGLEELNIQLLTRYHNHIGDLHQDIETQNLDEYLVNL